MREIDWENVVLTIAAIVYAVFFWGIILFSGVKTLGGQ